MQFIHLVSIDDERVAAYTNLTEIQLRNKLEPSKGLFIAESPKVIDRALAANREPISLLVEEPWIEGMAETFTLIDNRWGTDIPVYVASPEQLKQLTGYRLHRGALAAMKRWPLPASRKSAEGHAASRSWKISSTTPMSARLCAPRLHWMSMPCW